MNESLAKAIHDAFPVGTPPARPVTGHRCPECDEVDALMGGRRWPDVAADFPGYCHDVYPLLNEEAQHYYLPAYMITALDTSGGMQGTSLESALAPNGFDREKFSSAQRAVIRQLISDYWQCTAEPIPAEYLAYWQD